MIKKYLAVDVGNTVFLVFSDVSHRNMKQDIVLQMEVSSICINETGVTYTARTRKVVFVRGIEEPKLKDIKVYKSFFSFRNDNIDTGVSNEKYFYPVFTTKEKCISYLRGEQL